MNDVSNDSYLAQKPASKTNGQVEHKNVSAMKSGFIVEAAVTGKPR